LEGTLKIIWFPPPCRGQGPLSPDQVAQSPIQPGLEHFQGEGASTASLGNQFQCLMALTVKKISSLSPI